MPAAGLAGGLLTAHVTDRSPPDVRFTLTLAQVIASVIAEQSTGAGSR